MDEELFDPSCSACERAQEDFAKQERRIAELERELVEQARLSGMGSEREAALMAKVERLERENHDIQAMYNAQCARTDELIAELAAEREVKGDARVSELESALANVNARLAAAQATISRKDEALRIIAGDGVIGHHENCLCRYCVATEALTLPADRAALDAMLADARKEGMPWQPIETAPEDGKCLVCCDTDDGPWVGRLDRDKKGNWIHEGEPTFCHSYYFRPVLWCPLPDEPSADAIRQAAGDE